MDPLNEIAPALAYLLMVPFVVFVIWWEWKQSETARKAAKRRAAEYDAQRQRWAKKDVR